MFLRVVSHWFKGDISISNDLFFSAVPLMQPFWETQRGKLGSPSLFHHHPWGSALLQHFKRFSTYRHVFFHSESTPTCMSFPQLQGTAHEGHNVPAGGECSLVCQNSCEWRWEPFWKLCVSGAGKRGKRVHEQETYNPCKSIWFQCMLLGSDLFYVAWILHR